MAVTYEGEFGPFYNNTASYSTSLPSAAVAGDLLLLIVDTPTTARTVSAISGWTTEFDAAAEGVAGGRGNKVVFSRIMESGDSGPTVTISSSGDSMYHTMAFAGFDETTPLGTFGTIDSAGFDSGGNTPTAPGITTTRDDSMALALLGSNYATYNSAPSGWTEIGDDYLQGHYYKAMATAGATGDAVPGVSDNQSGFMGVQVEVLAASAGVDLDIPKGSYTLTGYAPTVAGGGGVAVPAGSFTLTGHAPAVGTGVIVTPPKGSFTLTGHAPAVGTGILVVAPKGSFTLTGYAPAVTTGASVAVPAGSFTLTGYAPAVVTSAVVDVPKGGYTLTGYAPTVAGGGGAVAPKGTFALTGYAPTVAAGASVAAPKGAFTLTGYAPTVGTGASIAAPLGSFALTGYAPAVGGGASVEVPSGSFTLTGYAPTVDTTGVVVIVPKRSFMVTGYTPGRIGAAGQSVIGSTSVAGLYDESVGDGEVSEDFV